MVAVEQATPLVAEAVLAPTNAIRALAASAARPSIFRYFIVSPFAGARRRRIAGLLGADRSKATDGQVLLA